MPASSDILKYLKVKALAERGDPGERDNASRILSRLEESHPGIKQAAERYQRQQEKDETPEPAPSGWPDSSPRGGWGDVFNFVRTAATEAYGFAQTAANAYAGRALAEEYVETATRATRAGNVVVSLKMPLAAFNHARRMNLLQKQTFRQTMHELLNEELDTFLGEEEDY